MEYLTIEKAYIENNKLISNIKYDNKSYDMYFEVEAEFKKYLCDEVLDSFLISLIPFIVKHEYDVKINGKISSKLYYQIINYLLPLLCKEFNKRIINIDCELTDINFDAGGVGASISCGVDSFYTLLKHRNQKDEKYNITHLTFFNAGSNGQYGGLEARELYYKRLENIKLFCDENNYKLVTVDSNMNELIMMNHEKTHTFRTLGCVFALQKLFCKYYFASGLPFNGSHINEFDTAYYDILNVHCLSTENISFYCSGIETSRIEKIKYISDFEETYNWLNVCVMEDQNCGKCNKCIRTMTALDSIGKLDKYKKAFDLKSFYKNREKILTNIMSINNDKISKEFYNEIIKSYEENNITIPIKARILSFIPSITLIKRLIKKILPKKLVAIIKRKKNTSNINDGWID